ncbi:hypothetical protein WS89_04075 [Burkholderia sp. MSMB1072]|uniref:hypothetical protein n=1 Tax=Burkholderia sp. MSMB1072 TaxID=1637871 RepID=UPI000756EE11|nr:hypothetical protein [Burkholderia sp. MSMB1072]KVH64469.1 hypothetical protein WS89_04075 [Burkholderia sp. MSMB1072]
MKPNIPITLPEDWTVEPYGVEDAVTIVAPGRSGFVTVAEKRRNFMLGTGLPRRSALGSINYSGRGWRAKLFTAAVESLQRAIAGTGENDETRRALYGR